MSYASKGDLVKHLTKVHGDLAYKCERPDCLASFRLQKELRDHYEMHAGWQPQLEEEEEEIEADPEYELISVEDTFMEENSQM